MTYAIQVIGKTVIWLGTDWDDAERGSKEFLSERKSRKDAVIFANALCASGAALLIRQTPST